MGFRRDQTMLVRVEKTRWNKWLFRVLAGLFLLSLIVGVPAYFVWRVACK